MLKLRYFWRLAHLKDHGMANRVFKHRRKQFLLTKRGFIHDIFNLCCKYDVIDFWNGKLKGLTNPASYIKDRILAFSLKNDLNMGRLRSCAFSKIYLSNIFSYQKSYHLVEPFLAQDFFSSAPAKCFVTKFLLQSHAFHRKCVACTLEFKDIVSHQLFSCRNLEDQKRLLRSKLVLYNFPSQLLDDKKNFYVNILRRKIWTKCFSEFLADIDNQQQS